MRRDNGRQHNGGRRPDAIRLAVFDLDGTLTLSGTSVLIHLGRAFGFADTAEHLSAGHAHGTLTNAQVSQAAAEFLRNRSRHELQRALHSLPMVDGIAETVDMLIGRQVRCALATITFDFAAKYVAQRYGFQDVMATTLEWSLDARATGHVQAAKEPSDKRRFIRRQCARLGIHESEVLVVGDTYTDIPAMKVAGFSIGFNPTPDVEQVASISIHDTRDLRHVMPHIRHLLSDPA